MRRMKKWMRRAPSRVFATLGIVLSVGFVATAMAASTASAISANFDLVTGLGFDASTLPPPDVTVDLSDPMFTAGDVTLSNFDVGLTGTSDVCILASGSTTCQPTVSGVTGPFSVLVSITIASLNDSRLDSATPFTLVVGDLGSGPGIPSYNKADVSVDLNPAPIPGLDTSAVPAFDWDPTRGVGGFEPTVLLEDTANQSTLGEVYTFVGWTVTLGQTVTFKYDVSTAPNPAGTPQFAAAAFAVVVPEPGTALLMGLGLAGLALADRR